MGNSDKPPYTPTRCKACGLTQKECHQAMKTMHDLDDPTKCCFRGPKYIADKHIKETGMQYNLKNKGDYPPATQDKDKPPQKASIPNPKMNAASAKIEQEEEITQPIANTSRFDPIQDLITAIEAGANEQQLHSPTANMLNDNITDQQKDKEKAINILGELQYCEDCNEFGEAGNACEYCIQSYSFEDKMEESNCDKQLHTPSVAMLNAKITTFFHKKKSQKHKHNTSDKEINNAMKNIRIKKKTSIQKTITTFMKIKEKDNHNNKIKDHISPDSSHTTLNRWNALVEEGEQNDFDYPPSDEDFDMSTVVTELTYQNQDEQESHKPIFNMSELATVTKPPPIKPHQHESYQK